VSTNAGRRKRRALYVEFLLATAAAGLAGSYLLAKPGADRAGARAGVAASALLGLLALYLKQWAIERSLKASLAMVGILFAVRLIVLAIGLGFSRSLGFNAVAFAAGFLGVYFVVQWIEIGYLTNERNRANREGI
jgi:hypothetical protein